MESVARDRMLRVRDPPLLAMGRDGVLDRPAQARVVAASAEGYAFGPQPDQPRPGVAGRSLNPSLRGD